MIFVIFSLIKCLVNDWLLIHWSKIYFDLVYTSIDFDYSLNLPEFLRETFIIDILEKEMIN